MSQRPSKPLASTATRARPRPPAPQAPTKPAIDIRSRTPRARLRPLAQPGPAEVAANTRGATGPQGYLQWAGFMAGAPNADFGAYFVDLETGGTIQCTWTPAPKP